MKRIEALQALADLTGRHPVVVTCAATSRELASVKDGDNHLYLLDAMGLVGSVATGLALGVDPSAPKVVGIEGDGSLLMNPNVLPTGGYLAPDNLLLVLLDNGVYGSTGALPTYSSRIDLGRFAAAVGWTTRSTDSVDGLKAAFGELLTVRGPAFLHARIEAGNAEGIEKLLTDPVSITDRFTRWLREVHASAVAA
ncbi:thiamine pyrophosphate-dependent enzyme [Streptomyces phaeochromogenes]|uniref:thiamine pyrophosphate-dependent enzyme n=1 Tax=Streptomyces phaeochromogenes TaxID=1923 RepID=UPI002DD98E68|nr:thiamine pyrophosphate-dependent enzyme [Streptomyces phaeochromogenes]WRZ26471.1 thiamine pyrophosphate-dependent enzyme [Streptomyces phaeochromogenes]